MTLIAITQVTLEQHYQLKTPVLLLVVITITPLLVPFALTSLPTIPQKLSVMQTSPTYSALMASTSAPNALRPASSSPLGISIAITLAHILPHDPTPISTSPTACSPPLTHARMIGPITSNSSLPSNSTLLPSAAPSFATFPAHIAQSVSNTTVTSFNSPFKPTHPFRTARTKAFPHLTPSGECSSPLNNVS